VLPTSSLLEFKYRGWSKDGKKKEEGFLRKEAGISGRWKKEEKKGMFGSEN